MNNILNTRVKFVRNLKDIVFTTKINNAQQQDINKLCKKTFEEFGLKYENIKNIGSDTIEYLINDWRLEKEFVGIAGNKGYASNHDVNVQINGLNHIELFATDLNLDNAYQNAKQFDQRLCNKLNFAYSDKYGFLSPDISCIGSGIKISVLIMLPALSRVGAVDNLPKVNDKLHFNIKPMDLESGLYVIETGANLGYTEKQICELTTTYINKILKAEIDMCNKLNEDADEVLDKLLRAKAIINSCVKISAIELNRLLADIVVAINSGVEKDIKFDTIVELFNCSKNNVDKVSLAKTIKNRIK